ncbi:MAG: hypothetical protein ACTH1D_03675 [Mycobacteriaceae bacterium]|uniref:hypothetical protein n=1 Tax=Corynebacterium sp. TaxID=1720 RepID=UPI003F96B561
MNFDFVSDFFTRLSELAADVDTWQQFVILFVAGAVPFVESYLGSFLGVALGIEPTVLVVATAIAGNLLCTFLLIAATSRARSAVTNGRGADGGVQQVSTRRQKIGTYFERLGVPGVSLLGPIILASQITGPTLVALGAGKRSVYIWQGIAIVAWGILFGFFGDLVISWYM